MIRYDVNPTTLKNSVADTDQNWIADAAALTAKLRNLKRFFNDEEGDNDIWGRIKTVYRELQFNKCAYCERELPGLVEGSDLDPGSREHDVEHFRPKGRVRKWPTPKLVKALRLDFGDLPLGDASEGGYYLLAYHLFNYATACATCNQSLKSDYFPIAATRDFTATTPAQLKGESCYLIYPIGRVDEDPENLITFDGISPVPCVSKQDAEGDKKKAFRHARAEVTISFFVLARHEHLRRARSGVIVDLYLAYRSRESATDAEIRQMADDQIKVKIASSSPHASCARAYLKLLEQQPARAKLIAEAAREYQKSGSWQV